MKTAPRDVTINNVNHQTGNCDVTIHYAAVLQLMLQNVNFKSLRCFSFNRPEEREWGIQQKRDTNATEAELLNGILLAYITCNYYKI